MLEELEQVWYVVAERAKVEGEGGEGGELLLDCLLDEIAAVASERKFLELREGKDDVSG